MKNKHVLVFVSAVWLSSTAQTLADALTSSPETSGPASTNNAAKATIDALPLSSSIRQLLTNQIFGPDTYNTALKNLLNPMLASGNIDFKTLAGIITNLNIKFEAFDTSTNGGKQGLGLQYSYQKSITQTELISKEENPLYLSFDFNANGNVAFNKDVNPANFLDTGFKLHLFQSIGGVEPLMPPLGAAYFSNAAFVSTNTSVNEIANRSNPKLEKFLDDVKAHIIDQFYWDVGTSFSLEANQTLAEKQWAAGLRLALVKRAWNDDSFFAKYNLFDYPFAALRYLSGADPTWKPSGQALPSLSGGIDLVGPYGDTTRLAVDHSTAPYPRLDGEVNFKSKVAKLMGKDVWFSASYRYYDEIDAPSSVREASLAKQEYFVATIGFASGFNFNYSNGKLPFDQKSNQVYALGYSIGF